MKALKQESKHSVSIFRYMTIAEILKAIFEDRCFKNANYSIRAFARDLEMTHAMLNMLVRGDRYLSKERAEEIAEKLNFSATEKDYFAAVAAMHSSKEPEILDLMAMRANKIKIRNTESHLTSDQFQIMSQWFHAPLLGMIHYADQFQFSPETAAKRLEIPEIEVRVALDKFKQLGLVRFEQGKWVRTKERIRINIDKDKSDQVMQHFYRQMHMKAYTQVGIGEPGLKHSDMMSIPFDTDLLAKARIIIEDAVDRINALTDQSDVRDSVYQLNIAFFPLTNIEKPKKETNNEN